MVPWIAGIPTAVAAIIHLALTGELNLHLVAPTPLGVFFSVLLGCGLCALFFPSDESGHDRSVADATTRLGAAADELAQASGPLREAARERAAAVPPARRG